MDAPCLSACDRRSSPPPRTQDPSNVESMQRGAHGTVRQPRGVSYQAGGHQADWPPSPGRTSTSPQPPMPATTMSFGPAHSGGCSCAGPPQHHSTGSSAAWPRSGAVTHAPAPSTRSTRRRQMQCTRAQLLKARKSWEITTTSGPALLRKSSSTRSNRAGSPSMPANVSSRISTRGDEPAPASNHTQRASGRR